MNCKHLKENPSIVKRFMFKGEAMRLCPECYEPYYQNLDLRTKVTVVPEKEIVVKYVKHKDYVDAQGKEVELTVIGE